VTEPKPRVAVIVFPGSNDDRDAALALELLGAESELVWHEEVDLSSVQAIVLPGGFSYGDYLRCGALARLSPVMGAVREFALEGGPVLGICNGFQILCEAGLLPGVLRANRELRFVCRDVTVRVERAGPPFLSRSDAGQQLVIPVKHGEGCYIADASLLEELEAVGQVVLRYVDGENPNGALDDIAGVVNADGNVMGLMPHPEHAVDPLRGSVDGAVVLGSLVDSARERLLSGVA
jgi:phosphoribosylformylglycinamidine synthase subunit PurQ / glutaminase